MLQNWFTTMAAPQVNQTKILLDSLYEGKIDLSDYDKKPESERKSAFYTRALAAYYLHYRTNIGVDKSALSVTDGYGDNGIDSIYYDEINSTLYLVQSKFLESGSGETSLGDMMKFKEGILNIIDEKFDQRFNAKIKKFETPIRDALSDTKTRLVIGMAYTGKGFSKENRVVIDELMEHLNDTTDWAVFDDFNMRSIYSSLLSVTSDSPIDHEITITNWGVIDEPFKSYYGQIPAYRLAEIYNKEGKKLFAENIRGFIGLSSINTTMLSTIENEPENFIYFNNGITVICNSVEPVPGKTTNKTTGSFSCKGMQVINGAQTVGSLGAAIKFSENLKKCVVFIRLIPLADCPEGFGNRITVASNTQNKIEKRDFASLDPVQHNLRTELALNGIAYHYKRTEEPIPLDDKNCSLEEATIALACNKDTTQYSVTAKREIGKLWDDINKPPYTELFNASIKWQLLFNSIKVFRGVIKYLNANRPNARGQRLTSIHTYGNYFILHIAFKLIDVQKIMNPNLDIDTYLSGSEFTDLLNNIVRATFTEVEINYGTSLIHQLFRNYTKCSALGKLVLLRMNTQIPNTPYPPHLLFDNIAQG